MLKKVSFQNYRCLKELTLSLGPLTVVVGANATGKSTVLQGLQFPGGLEPTDAWRHESGLSIRIAFEFDGQPNFTKISDARGRNSFEGNRSGRSSQLLHLDLNALRQQNQVAEQQSLAQDGSNLTNVFATLSRRKQEDMVREFCALVPMFSDVNHKPTEDGFHTLVFQDRWSGAAFGPHEVSDGTMLVLAYLLAQHQELQVDLLAIEEPERGLHPYLLGEIVGLFRKMARGEVGTKPIQIVLATHSAELLDHLEPEEVRFLSRNQQDGSVGIETISEEEPNWQQAFREHEGSLGNLWLAGGHGGVPSS
ncbi:MAG: hypothetical protein E2O39_16700 [Planctomycetota bacterium]|nr:MAG: hypothetical protein E2O39_16700 [Planctomycetota bacterium]